MVKHIDPEKKAKVIELLKAGDSQRVIYLKIGVARDTIRNIIINENIIRPPCACGRPGGHKGVCFDMRTKQHNKRPTTANHNFLPANTEVGKVIDRLLIEKRVTAANAADGIGITQLKLTQLRHKHKKDRFRTIIPSELIDKLVSYFAPDNISILRELHTAAIIDWGFRFDLIVEEYNRRIDEARHAGYNAGFEAGKNLEKNFEKKPFVSIMERPIHPAPTNKPRKIIELSSGNYFSGSSLVNK